MADTNHVRRDDYVEFSENDPFAELTRIMGHDPRAPEPVEAAAPAPLHAAAAPAEDDFRIDLERELAADFDFSEFDEPARPAAGPVDWREDARATEPAAEAMPEPDMAALDAGFADFFAEEAVAPVPAAAQPAYAPVAEQDAVEESLDDALERELFAEEASFAAAEPEPAYDPEPAAYEPKPAYESAPAAYEPAYEPKPTYEPAPAAYEPEPTYESAPSYEPDLAYEPEPVPARAPLHEAVASSGAADDDWAAEAEFDLDFLERELAAGAPQAVTPPPASFEAETFPEPQQASRQPVAEPVAASLSLEEELSLLLADDPAPAAPAPRREPASTVFGRSNFAAAQPVAAPAFAAAPAVLAAAAAPAMAAARPAFAPAASYTPAPVQPTPADDGLDDIFGDDFALDLDGGTDALPDVETVEVAETVQPVADDLDIPEIDYGVQAASAPGLYDDLEADFADVFGEAAPEEPAPAAVQQGRAGDAADADAGYVLDDTAWQAAQAFPDAGFDYETDLEQAIAMSAYDEAQPQPAPRRRGLLVAAAIGGIVALGAAGVFGVSMLGGGSDTPALVRADPEPMKVRPENPGGTTVPNQDNEVYQRVGGGQSDAAPAQESLITTAEEPVDVVARTAPQEQAALAPGIDDEAPDDEAVQPKSEERIEQAPQATSPVEAGESVAVAPRRVRTMVVRPDGTMVPREDPAPAAVEQPAAAIEQPAAVEQATSVAGVPTLIEPAAEAEVDEGPTVETPQTVAVVPTQRSAVAQPAAAPRPAAPQPAVQQPAAQAPVAAVSAPAAAAAGGSEWSMQIASQPTAEGAQSAYQDLARRYGSVLEGRGVNIVRADIEGRGTYYRVRIPASSREQAIQLCTRFKAAGGSCFVSR